MTVCATPNACYSFVNWTLNGNVVSTSACYTFAATNTETIGGQLRVDRFFLHDQHQQFAIGWRLHQRRRDGGRVART